MVAGSQIWPFSCFRGSITVALMSPGFPEAFFVVGVRMAALHLYI